MTLLAAELSPAVALFSAPFGCRVTRLALAATLFVGFRGRYRTRATTSQAELSLTVTLLTVKLVSGVEISELSLTVALFTV